MTENGRISVNVDSKFARSLAKAIDLPTENDYPPVYTELPVWELPLNIVIQVVGSRGDVQPFVAIGNRLQQHGHRVRIATHSVFKDFVHSAGLEFFPIGGDPANLMAFMVKNPGLIPSMKTLKSGEISEKRQMIAEMLRGCWRSCIEPDLFDGTPFVADAIIANPVSFAHVHCAQALCVPVHLMFTMPWTQTQQFPHPLANISNSSLDLGKANYISYLMAQALTWQGLADVFNTFRRTLHLQEVSTSEGPFLAETLKIPYTYCWSPAIVPKPLDWPAYVEVVGFIFREPPKYNPPVELVDYLGSGSTPIYVGFGSIVIDDPDALLATVLAAVHKSGVRAVVSKGWSNLSNSVTNDQVYFVEDCPHEWLFQHVSAVVHHGGAGTTAAGLLHGRPTAIIPFFGDQPFWGDQIASKGVGPSPIPHKQLTVDNLLAAIQFCLDPTTKKAAISIAETMRLEKGVEAAVQSFHRRLSQQSLQCDMIPTRPAVYEVRLKSGESVKISGQAAAVLLDQGEIKAKSLTLYRAQQYDTANRRWDPVTSSVSSYVGTVVDMANEIWYGPVKVRKEQKLQASVKNTEDAFRNESECTKLTAQDYAAMAGASALSIPKLYGALLKGLVIDLPHATTEGLRNAPRLYGENVPHMPVVDAKSGLYAGAKNFVEGLSYGLADLVVQPYKGAKEEGTIGFARGLGKGLGGTISKVGSGALGLWSYPAHGAFLSIRNSTHSGTKKKILKARREHDTYFSTQNTEDREAIRAAFAMKSA